MRHRHRHRRRVLKARLLHLYPGAPRRFRAPPRPEDEAVPAGGRGVSGILCRVFQAGDDGRRHRRPGAGGVRRAGKISRREAGADRHRQRQESGGRRRRAGPSRLPAGHRAVGRRHQRILQIRRGVFPRARRRARQGISRHHRRRHSGADRRSVPAGYFLRARSRPRADAAPRRNLCRGDQHRAQGHPARQGALPHLLRHQRRPAALRGGARRHHRLRAQDQRRLLQLSKPPIRATSTNTTCSSA